MFRLRYIIITVLLFCFKANVIAQDNELTLGLRAGHNAIFGGFAATSIEGAHHFGSDYSIGGGIQYNTIGKTAMEARPTYHMDLDWGKLTAEGMLAYTNLSSVNSYAVGAGAELSYDQITVKLGYYYRLYGSRSNMITEPFNVFYELRVNCLKNSDIWDLDFVITNCEVFELERHYQPSFMAEGSFNPSDKVGFFFGLGYKPAGSFHLTADYYQSYLKTGICYRW